MRSISSICREGRVGRVHGEGAEEFQDVAASGPDQTVQPLRALVVEDDETWNGLVERVLASAGLHVTTVRTASEAIQLAMRASYDVALIDYLLLGSGESGIEVAQTVRQTSPNAVIILLTGWPNLTLPQAAQDVKIDDLVLKSHLSLKILQDRISEALNRRQLKDDALNIAYLDTVVNDSLSVIAHELRTPLVSIKRQAEALSSGALGSLSQGQTDAIKLIISQARRGLNLVSGHLELNRIANSSGMSEPAGVDLVWLLTEDIAAWQAIAAEKDVQLRLATPASPCMGRIDQNILRIALNPLIENAIKFSPVNGAISVLLEAVDDCVKIAVSDNGPGMSPGDVEHLLGLQNSPSPRPSARARGTGLGLMIARRAAELHGGRLEVESGSNGLTMILLLQETTEQP